MNVLDRRQETRSATARARLRYFGLLRATLIICAFAVGVSGCTKVAHKPPKSQLLQAKKDERLPAERERELDRQHIAPPPAYGNRVVMAAGETPGPRQF